MENIVSTDKSVERQITDSINENLTDSDLENVFSNYLSEINFQKMYFGTFTEIVYNESIIFSKTLI